MIIIQEYGARLYGQPRAKGRGSGTAAKLTPGPRTTTHLYQKSRVVE